MSRCGECGLSHDTIVALVRMAMKSEIADVVRREVGAAMIGDGIDAMRLAVSSALEDRWPRARRRHPSADEGGEHLTLGGVVRLAVCGTNRVYGAMRRRELHATFHPGEGSGPGHWRFDRAEVEAWIAALGARNAGRAARRIPGNAASV